MWHDHPSGIGQHPWLDPFALQDVFNPRPDAELANAGALAPAPEAFPFTDAGRREYYDAVRAAAKQQMTMQHQHMAAMYAAEEAREGAERQRREDDDDLLLAL
jgi:hypothetical protein